MNRIVILSCCYYYYYCLLQPGIIILIMKTNLFEVDQQMVEEKEDPFLEPTVCTHLHQIAEVDQFRTRGHQVSTLRCCNV